MKRSLIQVITAVLIVISFSAGQNAVAADVKPSTIVSATAKMINSRPRDLEVKVNVLFPTTGFKNQRLTVRDVQGDTLILQVIADPTIPFLNVVTPATASRVFPDVRVRHPGLKYVRISNGSNSTITVPITR